MQIIKLRAWNKARNNWYFYGEEIWSLIPELTEVREGKVTKQEDLDLTQFTELLDKNGKEIYFGDIVKFDFTDKKASENEMGTAVIWETMNGGVGIMRDHGSEDPWLVHAVIGGFITDLWEDDDLWTVEVIGNIYQNPELLTTEND